MARFGFAKYALETNANSKKSWDGQGVGGNQHLPQGAGGNLLLPQGGEGYRYQPQEAPRRYHITQDATRCSQTLQLNPGCTGRM